MGATIAGLKTGRRGFYLKTASSAVFKDLAGRSALSLEKWGGRELFCPAFRVAEPASATGAGDSAFAGFLAAFRKNFPPEICLKYACLLGWQNLQAADATSGIRSWEESRTILETGPPLHLQMQPDPHWSWSEMQQLWAGSGDLLHN
jgi:sugar/nucleoside kinase (ribokinase family)